MHSFSVSVSLSSSPLLYLDISYVNPTRTRLRKSNSPRCEGEVALPTQRAEEKKIGNGKKGEVGLSDNGKGKDNGDDNDSDSDND